VVVPAAASGLDRLELVGPPVTAVSENAASDGAESNVDASQNGGNPQPELVETPEHVGQAHVPVKKKGSRKR